VQIHGQRKRQTSRSRRGWCLLGTGAALLGLAWGSPATAWASPARTVVLLGDGVAGGLLRGGFASAHFGQADAVAITGLRSVMGPPRTAAPVKETGGCTIDAVMQWLALTAYFERGHFVGYSTLSAAGKPLQKANVVTWEGLRLGDTLPLARQIYGAGLHTSPAQGGSWTAETSVGTLEGYLSAELGEKSPPPRILSIEAGAVGCPAVTP
jgi:hypothetical protein